MTLTQCWQFTFFSASPQLPSVPAPALDAEILGAGVLPWQPRPHAEPGVPHTSNVVSLLTLSDGVGKHFGAVLSGIQGAATYLLIKRGWEVGNVTLNTFKIIQKSNQG